MDGVIVVPQHSTALTIGIVVVLVLANLDEILCPTIERSTRWRTMQMNGTVAIPVVDKANDALYTTGHDDGWSGACAIVADKTTWRLSRVNLLVVWLDVKLMVPDLLVGDRIDDLPIEPLVSPLSSCLRVCLTV